MEEVQSKGASRDSRGCSITVQSEVFPINHNHSYVGYPSCISIFQYISIYFHILPYVSIYIYVCVYIYFLHVPHSPNEKHIQTMASMAAGRLQSCRRDPAKVGGLAELTFLPREGPGRPLKGMNLPMGSPKWRTHFLGVFFAFLWFPMISYFKFSCFFWGGGSASWCWILLRMNVENNRARGAIYLIRLEKWASDSKSFCLPEKQGHRSTELMMDGLDLS